MLVTRATRQVHPIPSSAPDVEGRILLFYTLLTSRTSPLSSKPKTSRSPISFESNTREPLDPTFLSRIRRQGSVKEDVDE